MWSSEMNFAAAVFAFSESRSFHTCRYSLRTNDLFADSAPPLGSLRKRFREAPAKPAAPAATTPRSTPCMVDTF